VDFRIFVEPQQGATYDDLLLAARAAERLGFDGFFRSDHYLGMGTEGLPGPTDAWVTLAALARETQRVRLGTLMTSATFRLPGPLAIAVAGVDQMSGGRVELGLGAGWWADEHSAYGIPFPDVATRFTRLEEQLAIVVGLWSTPVGETFSYSGRAYNIENSPGLPKPTQHRIPVIVGGRGRVQTPRLAATFAAEFNLPFLQLDQGREQFARVRRACEDAGRDPSTLIYSNALLAVVGADNADVERRLDKLGRSRESIGSSGLVGTPDQVGEQLEAWRSAGSQRIYLQIVDPRDIDEIELFATEIGTNF
jgi:F420-dependent oxidoreductase-like protein